MSECVYTNPGSHRCHCANSCTCPRDLAAALEAELAAARRKVEYAISMILTDEDFEADHVVAKLREAVSP